MSQSLSPSPLENNVSAPNPRVQSPGPLGLRHRGVTRPATSAEVSTRFLNQRRNSTFSDTVSEARNSIRSSTDDLFFPRVVKRDDANLPTEESHWHSAPLGLALLPAIAGIFFQNGSAVVTDVTLLVLAAIFLNWSVRLPWDWYRSAQAIRHHAKYYDAAEVPLDFDIEDPKTASSQSPGIQREVAPRREQSTSHAANAASKELQIHELVALASCFVFPIIGTWLLHTIRSKLSRPSEGLVSNYNLTIFLLASEIRPFSHLLKMVQARTLHLQRVVASSYEDEKEKIDASTITDLIRRLDELEAHIAESAATRSSENTEASGEEESAARDSEVTKSVIAEATADIRKAFQPDIDALTRAVRRYEKRTAITTQQTESRLHDLETQVRDAFSLAAAAQRSSSQHRSLAVVLCDWIYALACLPLQMFMSLAVLPLHLAQRCLQCGKDLLGFSERTGQRKNKGKATRGRKTLSPGRPKRSAQQITTDPQGLKPIQEHQ
ncbi:hypothetical protein BJX96DRAFT_171698 [Aspergillus floccosus]